MESRRVLSIAAAKKRKIEPVILPKKAVPEVENTTSGTGVSLAISCYRTITFLTVRSLPRSMESK
jgi:hypothetical protein